MKHLNKPEHEILDGRWKHLVETGDDLAVSTNAAYQRLCEEMETKLGELRDLARLRYEENNHKCERTMCPHFFHISGFDFGSEED